MGFSNKVVSLALLLLAAGSSFASGTAEPRAEPRIAILQINDAPSPRFQACQEFLESAGVEAAVLRTATIERLAPYDLVVVPDWLDNDHAFYYALKVYYYRGGRLLCGGWQVDFWSKALISWLWDANANRLDKAILTSADGRAVYVRDLGKTAAEPSFQETFTRLRSSEQRLPNGLEYRQYEKKKTTWAVKGESLYLNERPRLLRGIGTLNISGRLPLEEVERQLAAYEDLNLNCVVPYSRYDADLEHFENCLDLIDEHGLCAFVWIAGPPGHFVAGTAAYGEKPLKDDWWLRHLVYKNHPAILGWNMCDDTFDRYYPFLERTRRVIRQYDSTNMVTTTMMDTRHPERLSPGAFEKWGDLIDFPITYLYPLQRDGVFAPNMIEGGLEDIQRLIGNTQDVWSKPVYVQIWAQAHMQGFSYARAGLQAGETFVPTAEQQRLLTYYILQAGGRGIVYFNANSILDENLGKGRRNEIGLVWDELEPVETIIAGGERADSATGQEQVEATAYTYQGAIAILLSRHISGSQRYVSDGTGGNVVVDVPAKATPKMKFYLLRYPEVSELETTRTETAIRVFIPELDLTAVVLGTPNADRIAAIRATFQARQERTARMALEVLTDKRAKTEVVVNHLPDEFRVEHRDALRKAAAVFAEVERDCRSGHFANAYTRAREGSRAYRSVQAAIMQQTDAAAQANDRPIEQRRLANIFFSLPKYYAALGESTDTRPGQLKRETLKRIADLSAKQE